MVSPQRIGLNCSTASLCANQTESAEKTQGSRFTSCLSDGACRLFRGGDGQLMSCKQCLCPGLSKRGLQLQIPHAGDTLPAVQSAWVEHTPHLLCSQQHCCSSKYWQGDEHKRAALLEEAFLKIQHHSQTRRHFSLSSKL